MTTPAPEIDPLDNNQDGVVTEQEIDAAMGPRPESRWWDILLSPLAVGSKEMDGREWDQKRQQLMDKYAGQQSQAKADAAAARATQAVAGLGTDGEATKSGYLGVDDLVAMGVARAEVGSDGQTAYWLDTKDGARSPKYKNADPYKELVDMGPHQLAQWRRTMWLAGVMEPGSFYGSMNTEDLEAMTKVQTEANLTGVSWQDAIASRVEIGQRYGRPITDAEIAALDDDVPAMIKQYASANGIQVTDDFVARMQYRVRKGVDTPDQVIERLKNNYVKPMFPQFAKELDEGMTLKDLASPYMQTASTMLETEIGFDDPLIMQALSAKDNQGQPQRKSLWEFQEQLANDPRWKFTNNAFDTFESAVNGMVSEMGL